jgi:hypothetical protein
MAGALHSTGSGPFNSYSIFFSRQYVQLLRLLGAPRVPYACEGPTATPLSTATTKSLPPSPKATHSYCGSHSVPDVGDCPVAAPLPVLCVELECLTVSCTLMAHHITHSGGVMVAGGVLTPVLEACTAALTERESAA